MDIISAIASINALLIALVLFKRGKAKLSDNILGVWSLLFAIHFSTPFFIERDLFFHKMYWGTILGIVIASHVPFLFVYTNSLTNRNFRLSFKYLWHFLFVLIYIVSSIPLFLLPLEKQLELIYNMEGMEYQIFLPLISSLFIQIAYLVWTTIVLVKHQTDIKDEFSYKNNVDLKWIKRIVVCFAIIIVLKFVTYSMVSAKIISVYTMDYAIILANIALFYYLVYCGYQQKEIFKKEAINFEKSSLKKKNQKSKKKPNSSVEIKLDTVINEDPITKELLDVMRSDKLFLNQELSIGDLANRLKVHPHTLSKTINETLDKNFFEFVNEYRITEFKMLASNPKNKHISILGLAMDAGFNSKATFNRIFKNTTGQTPSQFRDNYKF